MREKLILNDQSQIIIEKGSSFWERVEQLESGQEVQDGAISDLGSAVSGLAEEGGDV